MISRVVELLTKAQSMQNKHSGKRGQEKLFKVLYGLCDNKGRGIIQSKMLVCFF